MSPLFWSVFGLLVLLAIAVIVIVNLFDRADERGDHHRSRPKLSHRLNVPRAIIRPNRRRS